MSHLSKQKHRSVYSCSSGVGHTILFHLIWSLCRDDTELVNRCAQLCSAGSGFFRTKVKVWVKEVEEQSVLVCRTGAPSKRPSHEGIQKVAAEELGVESKDRVDGY